MKHSMNQRAVTLGLAIWAAAATVILLMRGWETEPRPGEVKSQQRAAITPEALNAQSDDQRALTIAQDQALDRYDLCLAEGVPELILPQLEGQPLIGVHCGGSARMLRFVAGEPLLLLDVTVTMSPPHARAVPAPLLLSDVDGDGRADLLVGQRYEDNDGTPIGGSVGILRGASRGGFEPPKKLLNAFPLRLFISHFAADGSAALTLLHGRNSHHDYGPELWRYTPATIPPKNVITTLPTASRVLAQLDLDRDGREELLIAAHRQHQAGLWLWQLGSADAESQRFLPLGEINAIAIGDVDGDQVQDALIAGEALWTLSSQRDLGEVQPKRVDRSACAEVDGKVPACQRDPQILRSTRAGAALLKSYSHPELNLFEAGAERRALPIIGTELTVLSTHVLDVDGDTRMDVLAVVHPTSNRRAAQLAWISDGLAVKQLKLGSHRGALPEALLHTSDGLD